MILKEQEEKLVYSDGDITEKRMLDIAQKYPEDLSQEYIAESSEYTLNNTFSLVRQNILNWYPFREDADILEIGAGMGSLTGLLCDRAKNVTAVEMSEARAEVIRARYSERANLEVISEDITSWKTEKRYDYVIFIGVLEYAGVFSDSQNPYEDFLTNAKNLLKPNGVVLFAIENRFGLKYWTGGAEDHLQIPFAGLEGYTEPKTPRTFSKQTLATMLDHVGLREKRFYYVFPDYKFPEVICTDDFAPSYMALQKVSFTYSKNSVFTVNEKKLYKGIVENGVWPFFANSYLVEASASQLENRHVIHVSAKGESKKEFKVSTVIYDDDNVYKIPMHRKAEKHLDRICENTRFLKDRGIKVIDVEKQNGVLLSKKYKGKSAQDYFCELLQNNSRDELFEFLESYRRLLLMTSELHYGANICDAMGTSNVDVNVGPVLEKGFIDLTFYNAFYENNEFIFYDQEWCFENVPLNFILFYAVKSAYTRAFVDTNIDLDEIWGYLGLKNLVSLFDQLEAYIWSKVLYRQTDFYGEDGYCNRFSEDKSIFSLEKEKDSLKQKANDLQKRYDNLQQETQNLTNEKILLQQEKQVLRNQNQELAESNKNFLEQNASLVWQNKELLETGKKSSENSKKLLETNAVLSQQISNLMREKETLAQEKEALIQEKETLIQENRTRKENEAVLSGNIEELQQEVLNKQGHIELLLPPERELIAIKNSKMFKIMRFFCRILDVVLIIPQFIGRNVMAFIRMMGHVNIQELKIAWGYVKNEGIIGAYKHLMRDYHQGELKQLHVEAEEPIYVEEDSIDKYEVLNFPQVEKPVVSIVIPAYNQFVYTYNCMKSILENSGDVAYEIILADDCSTDLTKDIQQVAKNITVAKTAQNLLFLRNCNHAAEFARGKYILFLNNDTQVQKDWLQPLVDILDRDQTVGMVGSKLVYSDGTLQEAGGIIWNDASGWNYGRDDDAMKPEYNYVKEVDYISGAAIMIRASLWKELGGFDEYFAPAYCEDSDLAFQVRKAGYKVVYQPLSVVVHFEGKSNGTDLNSGVKKYQVENAIKFREKWKEELKNQYENGQHIFKARERGQGRKTILVIDHYVPQFDKDAGSKTTYQYLKMFVEKGYAVKFIGDNFYQHEPYTTVLQQMGIEVLYGPWYAQHWQEWILANRREIDFAYLNRPHITIKYIDFLKEKTNIKCIYYGHDLHFLRLNREYELTNNEEKLKEAKEWQEKELYIMRRADISYYPSCVEEKEIHKIDPQIAVKAITAYVYETFRNDIPKDFTKREGIIFVGGFGHPPNEDAVLWFAQEIYPRICEKQKITFYIVGSNPTQAVTRLNGNGIVVKGFVSEEELQELYNTCRLVVVPLRYGAGVKGKVVEALYYGTPMVTTSVGIEGIEGAEEIIEIADDADKFAESVLNLYNDKEQLKKSVDAYQKFVKNKFSTEAVWNVIKTDF